jgi:PAS domain S-box-containing protein
LEEAYGGNRLKEKRNPLRFYTWLLWGFFIVVETYIVGTNLYYLIAENDSWRSVIFDFSTSTVLAAFVLIGVYYFIKKTFTSLQKSEARYRELADSLPEIVFEMDLEGNLLYASMSAFTLQGYTQEDINNGLTAKDVLLDFEKSQTDLQARVEKNKGEASGEYTAIRKDGSTAPVIISSRLIYNDEGKVVGLSGVVTDITEQKKTEEKLRRMNAELDGYAHTVSHDLKNPISNVAFGCGTLQNLLDLPPTDQNITYIKEVAEAIINSSAKAAALIDELLLLAESGQVPKEVENVDLGEEVRLIITDKSLQADGVRFNTNDLGTVVASPTHVFQIFSNLIRNAVRFAKGDEPRIDILRLPCEGDSVHRFLVSDNGPGISEEMMDKVFIPFAKDNDKGETGMGLSIVERMVKVYGGDIRAFNDNGACFEFTLKDFNL